MFETSPLAHPLFRRLFGAQVLALLGMGLTTVALALLVYELDSGSAGLVLGGALGLKMAIKMIAAPIAGAYANRVPRRAFLAAIDVVRALLVGLYPFVDSAWQVFVLVSLIAVAEGAFNPVFQATIPDVLEDEETYTKALSYNRIAFELENLLSPLVAAALLGFATFDLLFELNAAAFVLSALLLISCRLPRLEVVTPFVGSVFDKVTRGMRHYFASRELIGVFTIYFSIAAGSATAIVTTVLYVKGKLGLDDDVVAQAMMGFGGGSILAALVVPWLLKRTGDLGVMLAGGAIVSAALALASSTPDLAVFIAVWTFMGFGGALAMTPAGRVITRNSTVETRPELFAAQYALSHASWLVLYPLAGLLAGQFEFAVAFSLLGALAGFAVLLTVWVWRGLRASAPAVLQDRQE